LLCTVTLADLTVSEDKPRKFRIRLDPLRRRMPEIMLDDGDAELLMLQVADLEELLQPNACR